MMTFFTLRGSGQESGFSLIGTLGVGSTFTETTLGIEFFEIS
jgi:hypothetical protein